MAECEIIRYDRHHRDGKVKIEGIVRVHEVFFRFSLNEQEKINPEMRGTISARDSKGSVAIRKRVENGIKAEQKISKPIFCYSFSDEDIKARVMDKAQKMFSEYVRVFESDAGLSARADAITAIGAIDRYGRRYMFDKHKNASEESKATLLRMLKTTVNKIPHKPIGELSVTEVNRAFTESNISERARAELSNFIDYCISQRYVIGQNPVQKRHKRKRSGIAAKKKASRIDYLPEKQEDKLFGLLKARPNGASCAVALMISGFFPKDIEGLTWEDVDSKGWDYVVVKLYRKEFISATHNYSRPVVPQTAEILNQYYEILKGKYGTSAASFPVAGKSRDPSKGMDCNRIVREAKDLLIGNFIKPDEYSLLSKYDTKMAAATRVLHNTYKRDLEFRCNLSADPGRLKFLLGESLANDITADAYTAFTSIQGERKNYAILKCLQRKEEVITPQSPDNELIHTEFIAPETNKEFARGYAIIELKPGESIHISSRHGHQMKIIAGKD